MDADDISFPERLECQVAVMEAKSEIGVCGCWWFSIDDAENVVNEQRLPVEPDECRSWFFLFGEQPIGHPCVMYRKELVKELGGYESGFRHAEDFRLWARMASNSISMTNIPKFLFKYRVHTAQVSAVHRDEQRNSHNKALAELLSECLATTVDCHDALLVRSMDLRPEDVTSFSVFRRLLEIKFNAIIFFYRNCDLSESLKSKMNIKVTDSIAESLGATTLATRTVFRMFVGFVRKLYRES
jgi:hypothetical protein